MELNKQSRYIAYLWRREKRGKKKRRCNNDEGNKDESDEDSDSDSGRDNDGAKVVECPAVKSRASTGCTAASKVSSSAKGAAWAEYSKKVLMDEEMGQEWAALMEVWWALEESCKFATSTKSHPMANRPKAVGCPDIGTTEEMEGQWWVWWRGTNPAWWQQDEGWEQTGEGSCDVLRCPGQNGFLSVLAWYASMDTPSDAWTHTEADVKWVLGKMVSEGTSKEPTNTTMVAMPQPRP
ncbi:hypothetical protein K438DRAFT_1763268 [Mycena galopus ATCC 62051]|nr:hypothetical protein K438DRAFT_1763268 [Mycena galopus ATCC 62051]